MPKLHKNEVEQTDCNSYKGSFLSSIVGEIFTRVIPVRLQQLAEFVYPESQCGFCSGQSTVDRIFFNLSATGKMQREK